VDSSNSFENNILKFSIYKKVRNRINKHMNKGKNNIKECHYK